MLAARRKQLAPAAATSDRGRLARPPSGPPPSLSFRVLARTIVRLLEVFVRTIAWAPVIIVATLLRLRAAPRLLRQYLQSMGGLFVKLGQILALRYDLLPPRYCAELAKLLD